MACSAPPNALSLAGGYTCAVSTRERAPPRAQVDPRKFEVKTDQDSFNETNTAVFSLDIRCYRDRNTKQVLNESVYSSALKWLPSGSKLSEDTPFTRSAFSFITFPSPFRGCAALSALIPVGRCELRSAYARRLPPARTSAASQRTRRRRFRTGSPQFTTIFSSRRHADEIYGHDTAAATAALHAACALGVRAPCF